MSVEISNNDHLIYNHLLTQDSTICRCTHSHWMGSQCSRLNARPCTLMVSRSTVQYLVSLPEQWYSRSLYYAHMRRTTKTKNPFFMQVKAVLAVGKFVEHHWWLRSLPVQLPVKKKKKNWCYGCLMKSLWAALRQFMLVHKKQGLQLSYTMWVLQQAILLLHSDKSCTHSIHLHPLLERHCWNFPFLCLVDAPKLHLPADGHQEF